MMVALKSQQRVGQAERLAGEHLPMVQRIASRLHRWYGWVAMEDLHSYAYLGLALAARAFQRERGVPFENFASRKAMFLAIDEMRKDGVLRRRTLTPRPTTGMLRADIPDPAGRKAYESLERRDICEALLGRLGGQDRKLLTMHYTDHMTFSQIAEVLEISESAVCLRHKSLIERLRKLSRSATIV